MYKFIEEVMQYQRLFLPVGVQATEARVCCRVSVAPSAGRARLNSVHRASARIAREMRLGPVQRKRDMIL